LIAIDSAVAISYRAPGVDFRSFLGLARELAIPIAKIIAANLKPSTKARLNEAAEIGPNSFRALPKPRSISIEGRSRNASLVDEPKLKMIRKRTLSAITIAASLI
jgi:hypothetical protein